MNRLHMWINITCGPYTEAAFWASYPSLTQHWTCHVLGWHLKDLHKSMCYWDTLTDLQNYQPWLTPYKCWVNRTWPSGILTWQSDSISHKLSWRVYFLYIRLSLLIKRFLRLPTLLWYSQMSTQQHMQRRVGPKCIVQAAILGGGHVRCQCCALLRHGTHRFMLSYIHPS